MYGVWGSSYKGSHIDVGASREDLFFMKIQFIPYDRGPCHGKPDQCHFKQHMCRANRNFSTANVTSPAGSRKQTRGKSVGELDTRAISALVKRSKPSFAENTFRYSRIKI